MPLEKEAYRDNLERIKNEFPTKEILNITEVTRYLGVDRGTVVKRFPFKRGYISVATLARELS